MTATLGPTQLEHVRASNRALVLSLARDLGTVTCPDLARQAGLSRGTAYAIAEELQRAGVLVADGIGQSTGGRRPTILRFEAGSWVAVGIEVGEGEVRAVLVDLAGTVLRRITTDFASTSPEHVAQTVVKTVRSLQAVTTGRILGVGIAWPGIVDTDRGIVRTSVLYGWQDVPLGEQVQARLHLPVSMASRSMAAALGEYLSGAGSGARHLVYIYAGQGLGAGVILDGQLYTGANFGAGELGHITVEPAGALCSCGNFGCLHTLASGNALLAQARADLRAQETAGAWLRQLCGSNPERLRTSDLAEAARLGDDVAVPLVKRAGRAIGIAAATTINLFNPDRIIIGGPLSGAGEIFLDAVREEARRRALAVPMGAVQFALSALAADAPATGAAGLVLQRAAHLITPTAAWKEQ